MTALVLVSLPSPAFLIVVVAVTIAVGIAAAHWGAFRPQAKRLVAASLAAVLIAGIATPIVQADDEEFVMMDHCKWHAPWSPMWIYHLCMLPRRSKRRLPLTRRTR